MYNYDKFLKILTDNPIIPVVKINDASKAVELAKKLKANGINIIEVTLRTDTAVQAIQNIIASDVDILVGVGTVCSIEQFTIAEHLGADFVVSPGSIRELLNYAKLSSMPYLPGVASPSEIMHVRDHGFYLLKLFPANIVGGIPAIKAFGSVYSDVKFCPTGGISEKNYKEYLSQPNVCAVGGTWLEKAL